MKHEAHLAPFQFGKALLETGDLDPVYVAVAQASLGAQELAQLLVAYWCLYHLGAAARLAELPRLKFWRALEAAARNDGKGPVRSAAQDGRWPRGSERRHWRGQQAVNSVKSLRDLALDDAEGWLTYLAEGDRGSAGPSTARGNAVQLVIERAREVTGFGPWIAFKVADMLERVAGYNVNFAGCTLFFYAEPREGGLYMRCGGQPPAPERHTWDAPKFEREVHRWVQRFARFPAPPLRGLHARRRQVNVQEVETIFCKFKAHVRGHYPVGKDTREVLHGLEGWGDLAAALRKPVAKLTGALNAEELR